MTVITKRVPLYVENPEGSEGIQWSPDLQDHLSAPAPTDHALIHQLGIMV